jgi:K+-transporting ATPase ATPase A chain
MTREAWFLLILYAAVLMALALPLGRYIARLMEGEYAWAGRIEKPLCRLCGVDPVVEMGWLRYATAILLFNGVGALAVYGLQRLQAWLPLNPQHLPNVSADSAFNTALSFVTNTNWQGYVGEATMSYLTQTAGLNVQNFLSAATGIVVVIALIRGLARHSAKSIGNAWVDLTRVTLWVLLPISLVIALVHVQQGSIQNFAAYKEVKTLETVMYQEPKSGPDGQPLKNEMGEPVVEDKSTDTQTLAMGPVASQVAIKLVGTNGGGFFNANSAHPYENPTPLTNFVQMLAIFLIPAALCFTFGRMVKDTRQGWTVFAAMAVLCVVGVVAATTFEQQGNPQFAALGVDQTASAAQAGGNMEGKETRFGIAQSALFAAITTDASCGAVNGMHGSFTPLGGMVPLVNMQLGEVVFGGVGSGLYGMLVFAILAVFIAGLMVGRTPEYLGKKIEAADVTLAALVVLLPNAVLLVGTAIGVTLPAAKSSIFNPGAHGLTEVLYAFSSAANNNGSAFGGLGANTTFYNLALGLAMFVGRFWIMVPVLAIAGSLAAKKSVPPGNGTLPTHTPLFVTLLVGTVLLVGALTHLPALALGPIVEHLTLGGR